MLKCRYREHGTVSLVLRKRSDCPSSRLPSYHPKHSGGKERRLVGTYSGREMVFIIRLLSEALSEVAWGLLVQKKLVGVCQVVLFLRISALHSTLHCHCFCCLVSISVVLYFLFFSSLLPFSLSHSPFIDCVGILIIPVWNGGRYFCLQELDVFSCLFTFGNVACWERNLIN